MTKYDARLLRMPEIADVRRAREARLCYGVNLAEYCSERRVKYGKLRDMIKRMEG